MKKENTGKVSTALKKINPRIVAIVLFASSLILQLSYELSSIPYYETSNYLLLVIFISCSACAIIGIYKKDKRFVLLYCIAPVLKILIHFAQCIEAEIFDWDTVIYTFKNEFGDIGPFAFALLFLLFAQGGSWKSSASTNTLIKYKKMLDSGAITQEEFMEAVRKL